MFTKNFYTVKAIDNSLYENKAKGCWIHNIVGVTGNKIPVRSESFTDTSRYNYSTSIGYQNIIYYAESHPKVNKDKLIVDTNYTTSTKNLPYGIVFGNGTEAESIDNYTMSGDLFTTYTVSSSKTYGYDENGLSKTIMYTLTNTGTEDFTISEIGLIGFVYEDFQSVSSSYNHYYYYTSVLFERTLLENPITIPANGGVGQVTYTVRLDYPVPPVEE